MSTMQLSSGEHAPTRYHPATRFGVTGFGFYVYLLTDAILFSAFFATFAVLKNATAGGPTAQALFDVKNVGLETACLLTSSFVGGLAMLAAEARRRLPLILSLCAVFRSEEH